MGAGRFRSIPTWLWPIFSAVGAFGLAMHGAFDPRGLRLNDTAAAEYPAWEFVHHGSVAIPPERLVVQLTGEVVVHAGHFYTNRPLGMILAAAPGQLFTSVPSTWAIAITAALLTGVTVWASMRLWGLRTGLLIAVASPLLYTIARTLWPETVCIPLLLIGLLVVRSDRRLWVLFPLVGFATLCRPPFGLLFVLVSAICLGRRRALWWPVAGFVSAVVGLYAYSHAVFGQWSLVGGYPVSHHVFWSSLWIGTVSFDRGILWWTPWLFFVRPGDKKERLILVVAILYVLGSWLTYDAWAGQNFLGYRYPFPLAVLAASMVVRPTRRQLSWLFDLALAWSIAIAIAGESLMFTLNPTRVAWSLGVPIAQFIAVLFVVLCAFGYYRFRLEPELARRKQVREPVAAAP